MQATVLAAALFSILVLMTVPVVPFIASASPASTNSSDEAQQIISKPPEDRYDIPPPVIPTLEPIVPASGQPLDLSNNMGNSYFPRIAVSGSNVFVIWQDNTPGNREIFYTRSNDGGASFLIDPVNLSNNPGNSFDGRIAASGSTVHALWAEETIPDIFYTRSINNGASFGETINLSQSPSTLSYSSVMALNGNNVHVAWEERSSGNIEIFYSRSTNNGAGFSTPVNLSNDSEKSVWPQIAVSGNNVHVIWNDGEFQNGEVMYSRSTNNGAGFSTPVNLSTNSESSIFPELAVSGNNVHVIWNDGTNNEVRYSRSTNNGAGFSTPVNLSNDSEESRNPRISVSGTNIHVVWSDDQFKISYRRSVDNGASFEATVNPNYGRGLVSAPQVIANGTNAITLWMDATFANVTPNNWEIFVRGVRTPPFITPFVLDLSNTRERSVLTQGGAVLQGSYIYAVWWEGELGTGNDIYFRKYPQN